MKPSGSPDALGTLQLAWLGDAIWEMHQRLRLCEKPAKSKDLHFSVVSLVRAEAQAAALENLDYYLTDLERKFVRKGRNRVGRGSRKVNIAIYGKATGFETLIGWLFLKDPNRLAQLLDRLDQIESDKKKD
ncbi:hypothetical protein EV10_1138 [Prochlorococcus marinus str. SS51]|nr:hypothetical protein EV04_0889 [Prochlorococcus marinus str. LG]KGG32024.1 hypothetical protein EV10_1138 [Prochlorococcus marinus str. SS51]